MTDYLTTFRTRLLHAEALVDLARSQRTQAEAGDYDGLIDSLTRKGRIIDRMGEAVSESFTTQWRLDREHLSDAVRQECELLLDRAEQCLDETLDHERAAIATVTTARQTVQTELTSLTQGRQSVRGYGPTSPPTSRIDLAS